ncbi:MAG: hypothetical protein WA418_18765, partial [Bradyrhizobium sp.]
AKAETGNANNGKHGNIVSAVQWPAWANRQSRSPCEVPPRVALTQTTTPLAISHPFRSAMDDRTF